MAKVRQDAWSHEDDLLLAETVLRHIREGSTQLNAFEEVGDKLNRTSAACGFRWNAEIRNKYVNAIDLAKRQRKEKKRAMAKAGKVEHKPTIVASTSQKQEPEHNQMFSDIPMTSAADLTMNKVIQFLRGLEKKSLDSNQSKASLEQVQKEKEALQKQVDTLNRELQQTKTQLTTMQEDYQAFIQIMDRARKMTVLEDQGTLTAPAFRMDKNGNLQQLAQGSN
ncbi:MULTISPECIES: RsfA family transcriptional regulator [Clostridia]|uniref:RsfA family transcriptional regulator n=1 Tax=Clostridia TaxID=186801 RepID=UPI000EA1E74C|nr:MULTISPECIES: RsfA family transcriptional regulator [Clostridia]NBJ68627.1 RsfA family transcriptional regulator [Roseburia sp. 1XD42-34]RKI80692.1 RsfA family transcriptional regulator [Clostridium sp. 1xD42-85]